MATGSLAQALERFGGAYQQQFRYRPEQQQVVTNIRQCRTAVLGGTQLHCNTCGNDSIQYHSCRNRHCPQCQHSATLAWREKRRQDLLPMPYFHLVFTLPHQLNGWVRLHPREVYRLLFQAVWATLKQFAANPKRLGGELGATMVLHTWGQALDQHVHLHCLVPAGAWSKEKQTWHPANGDYLFPVKALSRGFRGRMVTLLRESYCQGKLGQITRVNEINTRLNEVMTIQWVVYTKACHGKPERVLDYLSRYTYRIAISEARIVAVSERTVNFRWKDYRDGAHKIMALSGVEFLRRFLQHVLPKGFMRIRHYGFLSNRYRRSKLAMIRSALNCEEASEHVEEKGCDLATGGVREVIEVNPWFCRHCRSKDTYVVQSTHGSRARASPMLDQ